MVLTVAQIGLGAAQFQSGGAQPWYDLSILTAGGELSNRAMAFASAGKTEAALEILKEAGKRFPEEAVIFCNLSGLLIRVKRHEEAVAAATRALSIDVEYEKAMNFRAYAFMELGRYELALADLNLALRFKPNDRANLLNRAFCLEAMGREADARRDRQAVKRLEALGYEDDAPFEATRARRTDPDPPSDPEARMKAVARAVEIIIAMGARGTLVHKFFAAAADGSLPDVARRSAITALEQFGAADELERLLGELKKSSTLLVYAAAALLSQKTRTGVSTWLGHLRSSSPEAILRAMIINPDEIFQTRQYAAHSLAPFLDGKEIASLANSIPDIDSSEHDEGVGVALCLIKPLAERGGREDIERIARNDKIKPRMREIACECLAYFDRALAITLLDQLAARYPAQEALQDSIDNAKRHFSGQKSDEPAPMADPEVHEAFRECLNAPSADALEELAKRYSFISDPEFIENIEQHYRFYAKSSDKELLRLKIERLRSMPPDPQQAAFRAFARANSPEEMREAVTRFPILSLPSYRPVIERTIQRSVPQEFRAAFEKRLEWLRAIPPDEYETALEAFAHAETKDQMLKAIDSHPILRSSRFRQVLKIAEFYPPLNPSISVRTAWIDTSGPDPADALYESALDDLVHDRPDDAIAKIDRIRTLDPEKSVALLLGAVHLASGNPTKAIEELTKSIERRPSAMAYERRGKAHMTLHALPAAIADFGKAIELDHDNADARLGRGIAYSSLQEWDRAIEDLTVANRVKPGNDLTVLNLATLLGATGRKREAVEILDSVRDPSPDVAAQIAEAREVFSRGGGIPGQEAFEAFLAARGPQDFPRIVTEHPILADTRFLNELHTHIEQQVDPATKKGLATRFDDLIKVVQNPEQLAFDAMMEALDPDAMRRAANRLPLLKDPRFIDRMEQLGQAGFEGAPPDFVKRFRHQLAMLRKTTSSPNRG